MPCSAWGGVMLPHTCRSTWALPFTPSPPFLLCDFTAARMEGALYSPVSKSYEWMFKAHAQHTVQ